MINPHTPFKPQRFRLNHVVDDQVKHTWLLIDNENKRLLRRFFNNVAFLIHKSGLSRRQFKKRMEDRFGWRVSKDAISRFCQDGETHFDAKLSYLRVYALFFNQRLEDMFYRDYEMET